MFSAVGFDLGDTLVDYVGLPLSWQREYPHALGVAAESLGVGSDRHSVARAQTVLASYNTRLTPREHEVDDAEVFGRVFAALSVSSHPDPVLFDHAVDAFFSVFRGHAVEAPGGSRTIAMLEDSGIRVGVLTDVAYAMPRRLVLEDLAIAGLTRLDAVTLTSAQVGWRKPRPEGYERLADLLGVSTGEMLYVGNEQKDIVGAIAAGACAALVWRASEPAPQWGQHYTLAGLAELPALIT